VAAFGQILRSELLSIPTYGCLNVHASLLPRWRGASPINAVILSGDQETGVTIMKMTRGLDEGPILTQETLKILPDETAGALSARLAILGAELLIKTIPLFLDGSIIPSPQDHSSATFAPRLTKKDGLLDLAQPASQLVLKIRAFSPWPGTHLFWNKNRINVFQARTLSVTSPGIGVFIIQEGFPAVGTGEGILVLERLQLAGKKSLSGPEFLQGIPQWDLNQSS
jgi:methionyl-tRNA formyltransferase